MVSGFIWVQLSCWQEDSISTRTFRPSPNTYDILKCIAFLAMVMDHIGLYLFPDEPMFRAIGRMAFPLFLFLVGYSGSTRVSRGLWVAMLVTMGIHVWATHALFPINILLPIILVKLLLGWLKQKNYLKDKKLPAIWLMGVVWTPAFLPFFEYGALGFLFALAGFAARNHMKGEVLLLLGTVAFSFLIQQLGFNFSGASLAAMLISACLCFLLCFLLLKSGDEKRKTGAWEPVILLISENALVLYVLHIAFLVRLMKIIYPAKLGAFMWFTIN